MKAGADVMAGSGHAMGLVALEGRFSARGRWRERLPAILDSLEALGRRRRVEGATGDVAGRLKAAVAPSKLATSPW